MRVDGDGAESCKLLARQKMVPFKAILVKFEMNRSRRRRLTSKDWVNLTEVQRTALAERSHGIEGAGIEIQDKGLGTVTRECTVGNLSANLDQGRTAEISGKRKREEYDVGSRFPVKGAARDL